MKKDFIINTLVGILFLVFLIYAWIYDARVIELEYYILDVLSMLLLALLIKRFSLSRKIWKENRRTWLTHLLSIIIISLSSIYLFLFISGFTRDLLFQINEDKYQKAVQFVEKERSPESRFYPILLPKSFRFLTQDGSVYGTKKNNELHIEFWFSKDHGVDLIEYSSTGKSMYAHENYLTVIRKRPNWFRVQFE